MCTAQSERTHAQLKLREHVRNSNHAQLKLREHVHNSNWENMCTT